MRKKILSFMIMLSLILSMLLCNSFVYASYPQGTIKCYTIQTTGTATTYTTSDMTTSDGYISRATDEIWITQISGNKAYGSYPTSSGRKSRWFYLSEVTYVNSTHTTFTATQQITTYQRNNLATSYGYISPNDTVTVVYNSGSVAQVIYPAGDVYKMAWISSSNISSIDFTAEQTKFPNGKYWCHVPGTPNNPDGYMSTPCQCTKHGGGHTTNDLITGACGCNSFDNSIQCMGFARKVGYDLFGSLPRTWTQSLNASDVDNLRPGDYIRFKYDGHSAIVTGKDSTNIYVVECNYDGKCGIRWGGVYSISYVKQTLTEIRKHP